METKGRIFVIMNKKNPIMIAAEDAAKPWKKDKITEAAMSLVKTAEMSIGEQLHKVMLNALEEKPNRFVNQMGAALSIKSVCDRANLLSKERTGSAIGAAFYKNNISFPYEGLIKEINSAAESASRLSKLLAPTIEQRNRLIEGATERTARFDKLYEVANEQESRIKELIAAAGSIGLNQRIDIKRIQDIVGKIEAEKVFPVSLGISEKMFYGDSLFKSASAAISSIHKQHDIASLFSINLVDKQKGFLEASKALFTSPNFLQEIPHPIARLSGNEYFNEANIIEKIARTELSSFIKPLKKETSDNQSIVADEIIEESRAILREDLPRVDTELPKMLEGARMALLSQNPDNIRHAFTSIRELLTQIIHKLAPDDEIRKWSSDPSFYDKGKPTRKARLSFISRSITKHQKWKDFFETDIENLVKLFNMLQDLTHNISPGDGEEPGILLALMVRYEGSLAFILKINECNS
jgi:hypothetical protein